MPETYQTKLDVQIRKGKCSIWELILALNRFQ